MILRRYVENVSVQESFNLLQICLQPANTKYGWKAWHNPTNFETFKRRKRLSPRLSQVGLILNHFFTGIVSGRDFKIGGGKTLLCKIRKLTL